MEMLGLKRTEEDPQVKLSNIHFSKDLVKTFISIDIPLHNLDIRNSKISLQSTIYQKFHKPGLFHISSKYQKIYDQRSLKKY